MSVVYEAVEDGVAYDVMPVIERELACDECGLSAVAVLEHLEQISAFGLAQRSQTKIVDGEQSSPLQAIE